MKLIAMAGLAQTGKSTAATYMQEKYGFAALALAYPIKKLIATLLDEDINWIDQNKPLVPSQIEELAPGENITIRYLLQTLGTEWGRERIHPHIWINYLLRDLPWYKEQGYPGVVITDCRFNNEAEAFRKAGGLICHIRRPNTKLIGHISEAGVTPCEGDFVIYNNGTKQHIYDAIDDMLLGYSGGING